ncbi:MAG: hypothetical protein ACPGR1_00815 [Candidatus Poseidoniaceae archaeon]
MHSTKVERMSRRRQRLKDKRRQHALQSRDHLLSMLYDVVKHPVQHRKTFAQHLFKISRRHRLRLTPEAKQVVCRKCSSLLVQGSTARVRLRNGLRIHSCLTCGHVRRIPYPSPKEVRA